MNFFGNLYYRFYQALLSIGEEDTPRYNAVLLMSLPAILNVLTIALILGDITNRLILINLPKFYLLAMGLLVIAINSYLIFGNKRYLEIEERYRVEDKPARTKNSLIALAYIAGTVLLFVLSLVY